MAVVIEIDGKKRLVSDQERKKLNNRKIKPLKKKIKTGEVIEGSDIYFLGERSDNFPLYEGKVIEVLPGDKFKIEVVCRTKGSDKTPQILIKSRKRLKLEKRK